ncbi:uncharacterized protein B0H18DRAFT_1114837 [Fomitopsis serialis]|uniref:uncharacterized protein n=1 Tax=Fomitopsis serialis TaxID=139415 RepID=UPI002008528E|nr:uncharacterized protein B0H18DRAFT_1114837 [Neoantrodia serialis]KAH9935021.1 hypothetical protein B0H18DRAFT_1114837 [Neoantrodia serialis]
MAPLLSRTLDPLLGIFTGVFAYYLYESNPRTALPEDQRLGPLMQWKLDKWRQERERKLMSGEQDVDMNAIRAAVEKE